jgi:hypothetical protein
MGIAARNLYDAHILQTLNYQWNRLIGIAFNILWHMFSVAVA